MSVKIQKMLKTIWIYSRTLGVLKTFLPCLPLKKKKISSPENQQFLRFSGWSPKQKGLQSGKPAISTISGVVSKQKKRSPVQETTKF